MIGYIRGVLVRKNTDSIVLDVGGVGYEINVPASTLARLPGLNEEVKINTYLHFADDSLTLYGFESPAEKELFEVLLSVAGVGPKTALAVVGGIGVGDFIRAVQMGDPNALADIHGIGRKMAEKIVLEMRDRIKRLRFAVAEEISERKIEKRLFEESVEALLALGYRHYEARQAVNRSIEEMGPEAKVEEIVREALRGLAR
ncbi:MAG: Holliday junction branch migration protein RuvA [bacterium]